MSNQSPVWITEADVVAMMNMGDAIGALENGLLEEARGAAENMVKTHAVWGNGSTLHAIGATFPEAGFVGTKTWAHTTRGACPLLILFDSETGALRAIIEAFALGQMRTGSASGVATRFLAPAGADDFAIIGTGKQALTQVAAVVAVRPIRRVRVFGRDEDRRSQFASRVRREFQIEVIEARSIAEAVGDVPIITVVTRATSPVLDSDMIARGAHINAVGAIVPSRSELASNMLGRASRVVVDSVPQAKRLSRELIDFFGAPEDARWNSVESLCSLVADTRPRNASDDLTIFKSLGMGISDLALGMELYQRASERGLGRAFPHPQRVAPRLV